MREIDDISMEKYDQIFNRLKNVIEGFSAAPRMLVILMLDDLHIYSWDNLSRHAQMMISIEGYLDEWNKLLPDLPINKMLEELKN